MFYNLRSDNIDDFEDDCGGDDEESSGQWTKSLTVVNSALRGTVYDEVVPDGEQFWRQAVRADKEKTLPSSAETKQSGTSRS